MKATLKTFKSIQSRAIKLGYPQDLIEVSSTEIRFFFQDAEERYDYLDTRNLAYNVLSRVLEFFVGYEITILKGNSVTIKKGCSAFRCADYEGFADPTHY
jgi:hypothetical protein